MPSAALAFIVRRESEKSVPPPPKNGVNWPKGLAGDMCLPAQLRVAQALHVAQLNSRGGGGPERRLVYRSRRQTPSAPCRNPPGLTGLPGAVLRRLVGVIPAVRSPRISSQRGQGKGASRGISRTRRAECLPLSRGG